MGKASEALALRKALLQGRAALYRLEITQELDKITQGMRSAPVGLPLAVTWLARSGVLAMALRRIGYRGLLRMLVVAGGALLLAKLSNRGAER